MIIMCIGQPAKRIQEGDHSKSTVDPVISPPPSPGRELSGKNPKNKLNEFCQSIKFSSPIYQISDKNDSEEDLFSELQGEPGIALLSYIIYCLLRGLHIFNQFGQLYMYYTSVYHSKLGKLYPLGFNLISILLFTSCFNILNVIIFQSILATT